MNNNVTDDEIFALYRICELDVNSDIVPRTTINTGIIT